MTPTTSLRPSLPPIKELFKESWDVLTKNILNLFLLSVINVVFVVVMLLGGLVSLGGVGIATGTLQKLNVANNPDPAMFAEVAKHFSIAFVVYMVVFVLLASIVGTALQAAAVWLLGKTDEDPSLGSAMGRGFKVVLPMFLTGLITTFLIWGSMFVLIFPAVVIGFLLMFTAYEVIFEGKMGVKAIKGSMHIVTQHFGEILVRILAFALVYIALAVFLPNIITKIEPETGILLVLLSIVTNTLLAWFGVAFSITMYKQAKAITSEDKPSGMLWIWLVSLLGWAIFGGIVFAIVQASKNPDFMQAFQKGFESSYSMKSGTRLSDYELEDKETDPQVQQHLDRSQELFDQMKQTESRQEITRLNDENIQEIMAAIAIDPENAEAWFQLGNAYTWFNSSTTDPEEALDAYMKAEEFDPSNHNYATTTGDWLLRMERFEDAALQYQKAIRLQEEYAAAHVGLARSYRSLGINSEAIEAYSAALEILKRYNDDGRFDEYILDVQKEMNSLE